MDEKTGQRRPPIGADELHIKDVGVFYIAGKAGERKAYYADGRPVKPGKLWLCKHCQFFGTKEIDFARHMVEKHPEHAKGKTPEAKEATEKAEAAKKAEATLKAAAKKAEAEKAEAVKKAEATKKAAAKKAKAEAKAAKKSPKKK